MPRDLDEDLRVAHANPATLSPADQARRTEIVALLKTFAHELSSDERRRVALIRASFVDAGDYVALLGTRREYAWVFGELRRIDGRLKFRQVGDRRLVFELAPEISDVKDPKGSWFGRAATDRASFPVGPINLLERVTDEGPLPVAPVD